MPIVQDTVAEFQGLYGPYTVSERVLQKIWLRGDFNLEQARLVDGRKLEVLATGEWNLLGGPDFRGARLRIDGVEVAGDVEVHFHAEDWVAHGHGSNPVFARVGLHVVLFPTEAAGRKARRLDGAELPELVLLPLLHRDLEEYAADDALEAITARDDWRRFAELAARPAADLRLSLREMAGERWSQKVRQARWRTDKLGWSDAVHYTALEILGYRHNRAAMLAVAARCPVAEWSGGLLPEEAFRRGAGFWQLHGVRPANHPRARLGQYASWVRSRPDWPERLVPMLAGWAGGGGPDPSTRLARTMLRLPRLRALLARDLTGDAVGGTRLDTLVCDGFLPLAAAATGQDLFSPWFHWYLGDVPATVRAALPRLGVTGAAEHPLCHGYGQGLLAWLLRQSAGASA